MDKERRKRKEKDKLSNNDGFNLAAVKQENNVVPEDIPVVKQLPLKREVPLILSGREAEFAVERSESEDEDENFLKFSKPDKLQHVLKSNEYFSAI